MFYLNAENIITMIPHLEYTWDSGRIRRNVKKDLNVKTTNGGNAIEDDCVCGNMIYLIDTTTCKHYRETISLLGQTIKRYAGIVEEGDE